ncbi:FliM/FliN family flagellar motor C-terminal domain-containing protein [Limimaricola pyoseonensis]|uniref:Flagellar motor switch protein FliM n=1 Tax=Limimaricola pyoseonensis TaxID=521013 RepID=A0A1G6ZMA5_9RHOB|nr:FliM/FliN family flagellar motor C-terminal domain-containing protein [Limimaricola pyoseonensis]SDE03729.1 flagellar motor switch protein FliM [Limimaricola pyoseonensis]
MSEALGERQLLRPVAGPGPEPADLRRAVARAADRAAALPASLRDTPEPRELSLDRLLAELEEAPLLFAIERDGTAVGLAALDHGLGAALVEAQTLGRLSATAAPPRPLSGTDAALARGFPDALLRELARSGDEHLSGWGDGLALAARWRDARAAAMGLAPGGYRCLRLSLDLGLSGRAGELVLAQRAAPGGAAPAADWRAAFREAVLPAPAALTAVLTRIAIPLDRLEAMAPGQMLPLAGADLGEVRLEGGGGAVVARARLGQINGNRAVRLEPRPAIDLGPLPAAAPALPGAP